MILNNKKFNKLYEDIKFNTYICDTCKKVIFPKVEIKGRKCEIENCSAQIRGGLGNMILVNRICEECRKKMNMN